MCHCDNNSFAITKWFLSLAIILSLCKAKLKKKVNKSVSFVNVIFFLFYFYALSLTSDLARDYNGNEIYFPWNLCCERIPMCFHPIKATLKYRWPLSEKARLVCLKTSIYECSLYSAVFL